VEVIGMAKKHEPGDVRIGKFDILATYNYAKGLLDGLNLDVNSSSNLSTVEILRGRTPHKTLPICVQVPGRMGLSGDPAVGSLGRSRRPTLRDLSS
jgi:hypothetical protein